MSQATGLLYALVAAVAFGIQYVPVKKYEIFEGTAFQWFMCNGILMVGFIIAAASGELERGISPLVIFGGVLWALSNYLVLPLVKLLGIGLGFSLYHFVNLMVGYCIGRFGLFGVKKLTGELIYCDIGCFLVLASFFAMVFVEAGHESKDDSDSEGSSDESALSAEWDARARSMDPMAAECDVRFMATGGFSVFGVPEGDHPLGKKHGQIDLSRHEHITSLDRLGPGAQRLLGVILAILAGGLCGVQGVPATLWEASHPEAEAFAVALWNLHPLFQCGRDSRGEVEEVRHRPRLCQRLHLGRGLRLYDEGHFFPGLFRGVHLGRCRTHPCVKPPFCLCVQRDHGQEAVADLLRRLLLATRGRFAHCMLW